ncbi:hypothetical protein [Paraurantiacibacter namhicola]|uniref:DUF4013 domain-containing protein n=1 Tax=Paraurantiacibacter namhicola TaxID=645517 RepID=A0A1C7DA65_9SPHN|nr:hypothetical protein [Paraurantiacibacter namhicola]ANU08211.1 hypothetical protein A6F65_01918 [Paraurantiacibacter namhicola]
MNDDVSLGSILSRTFGIVSDAGRATLLYTLVLGGLTAAGILLGYIDTSELRAGFGGGFVVDEHTSLEAGLFELGLFVLTVVGMYMVLREQLASQGRLGRSSGSFWLFLGMSILALLGVGLGLLLLVVPGLFLIVRWSAANGFAVSRGLGPVDALKASWEATDGHSWSIFFAGLILVFGASIAFGVIMASMMAISAQVAGVVAGLLDAFADVLSYAFSIAVFCAVASDEEEAAAVFA